MKITKILTFCSFLFAIAFLSSCSQEENLITGDEDPTLAAAVVNCDLQGPCVDINDWRPDINTALNDCYTEEKDAKCSLTNSTQVKEFLLGQSSQFPTATGGPLSHGCCFNDVDIDYKVAQYKSLAYSNRPLGGYGPNFSSCNWIVTGYNFAFHSTAYYRTWIFKLTVTYTKQCCPMKQISATSYASDVRLQEVDDNNGGDIIGYEIAVTAVPGFEGSGFAVILTDETGNQLEAGVAERVEDTDQFIYVPNEANLGVPGEVIVEHM